MIDVNLTVNGRPVRLALDERASLASVVRGPAGLTGTKVACAEGTCGACTVLLDGAPVLSCILLAAQADGGDVVTVEGLASGPELNALQQAFIAEDAFQCGFCTPGQLVSATALLREHPQPSREQVRQHMSGNLCRCGAYQKIERAVLRAADGENA